MIRVDCIILQTYFQAFCQYKVIVHINGYSCCFADFLLVVVGSRSLARAIPFDFSAIWF